jgi:hypothetical protein
MSIKKLSRFFLLVLSCLILQVSFNTSYANHDNSNESGVVYEGAGGK